MPFTPRRVCIIGAGASGLPAIKWTVQYGAQPVCYEMSQDMGGLWRYKDYDCEGESTVMRSTVINTSKEMTAYSDFIPPKEFANFMHNTKLLQYFRLYAKHFDLEKHIQYGMKVVNVKRSFDYDKSGKWDITVMNTETNETIIETFDGVMVGTGHHTDRYIPTFNGQELFTGKLMHSHAYKSHVGFENDRCVVVGVGNSAVDVAVELSRTSKQVYLVTRRGTWVLHRVDDFGQPLDIALSSRLVQTARKVLPQKVLENYAQNKCNKRFDHRLYGLQPRHGLLSAHPTVNDELPNRIASGTVVVKPNIDCFTGPKSLRFADGTEVDDIDTVILCTGFSFDFPLLEEGKLIPVIENGVRLYKNMYPPALDHPTLAVLGLIQPLGSIMPISEMQARLFMHVLMGHASLPCRELMALDIDDDITAQQCRYLESRRHTIQRDYGVYMDELAEMIGCQVTLGDYWQDLKLLRCLITGPMAAYQYRLKGEHKWEGARDALLTLQHRVDTASFTRRLEGENTGGDSMTSPIVIAALVLILLYFLIFM